MATLRGAEKVVERLEVGVGRMAVEVGVGVGVGVAAAAAGVAGCLMHGREYRVLHLVGHDLRRAGVRRRRSLRRRSRAVLEEGGG